MVKKALSYKQELILDYIKKYIARNGTSPSVREIARGVGLSSPATVHIHIQNLINKGFLKRSDNTYKSLVLNVDNDYMFRDDQAIAVPLINHYIHKNYLKHIEMPDEFFYLSSQMIPKGTDVFVMEVRDGDLEEFGILEDDYAIFERTSDIDDDELGVMIISDNQLVIRMGKLDNSIVLGKVIGVYREF